MVSCGRLSVKPPPDKSQEFEKGCTNRNPCSSLIFSGRIEKIQSDEDLKAEIERLRLENAALKKPDRGKISFKVSEKGGLSVYGMGRFPVTLYREQWEKLLDVAEDIRAFIRENDQTLKKKE